MTKGFVFLCVLDRDKDNDGDDEGREGVFAQWLRSKCLSSTIKSSLANLQGALANTGNYTHTIYIMFAQGQFFEVDSVEGGTSLTGSTGSSPQDVLSAARLGLSRLLDHLLGQSDAPSRRVCGVALGFRPRLSPNRLTPPQPNTKVADPVDTLPGFTVVKAQTLKKMDCKV